MRRFHGLGQCLDLGNVRGYAAIGISGVQFGGSFRLVELFGCLTKPRAGFAAARTDCATLVERDVQVQADRSIGAFGVELGAAEEIGLFANAVIRIEVKRGQVASTLATHFLTSGFGGSLCGKYIQIMRCRLADPFVRTGRLGFGQLQFFCQ